MINLSGKKVLVVGLGKSGEAAALFLQKKGARVRLTEAADNLELRKKKEVLEASGIEVELGGHSEKFLSSVDLVVTSPGVPPEALPLALAVKKKTPIWSEMELSYRFCPVPIIGITGTNGKSTASTLLFDILRAAGKKTVLAGNIGTPLVSVVEELKEKEVVVLEVSSFQLERIKKFRPKIAVLLNITSDHLDRYPDFESYLSAKKHLFANQKSDDCAVINYDDLLCRKIAKKIKAKTYYYSRRRPKGNFFTDGDTLFLPNGNPLLKFPDSCLWGGHNQENIAAVCAAAYLFGIGPDAMARGIQNFRPLAHRLETVAEKNRVRYIDDSKATNVDSTRRALQSFPEKEKRLILILGGKDKGGSYLPLKEEITEKVKALILLGEATERIAKELGGLCLIQRAKSLPECVRLAKTLALPGDVVLLSPACSSFDMFENYVERGNIFKKAVLAALS